MNIGDLKRHPVWYKNCKSVRKRGGKICDDCPFRRIIEEAERDE